MGKRLIVELTDHQYDNILAVRSINMARAPYKGIVMSAINAIKHGVQVPEDTGEVSDGYHTFNQLYHQRAVLFAAIVNEHPDISWKSFKHSDGHYCFDEDGEMFIVGIDTPEGPYTYHYHKKYWDLFRCKELKCGKEWDGHTEKDVTRLLSLKPEPKTGRWIKDDPWTKPWCSECGESCIGTHGFDYKLTKCCPNCGIKMKDEM